MAKIPRLKGLEVTIKVDGETAREYDPPEPEHAPSNMKFHQCPQSLTNDARYMVKYIEVKPGAEFTFIIRRFTDFQYYGGHQIAVQVEVDGQPIKGYLTETHATNKLHQNEGKHMEKTGAREGSDATGWTKSPFRFSNLDIVEDGIPANQIKEQILQAKNLGYLRVNCYRLGVSTLQHGSHHDFSALGALKGTSSMSEKALKGRALDCRVGLGEGVRSGGFSSYHLLFDDPAKRPFAVFDFRYRSLEGLYKEGIIPRPQLRPGHVVDDDAPTREVDAFALPEAEARQMLQRLIDSRDSEPRIKPENSGVGGRDGAIDVDDIPRVKAESSRGMKRERSSTMDAGAIVRHPKERKLRNGRVEIDLTDD